MQAISGSHLAFALTSSPLRLSVGPVERLRELRHAGSQLVGMRVARSSTARERHASTET